MGMSAESQIHHTHAITARTIIESRAPQRTDSSTANCVYGWTSCETGRSSSRHAYSRSKSNCMTGATRVAIGAAAVAGRAAEEAAAVAADPAAAAEEDPAAGS